LLNNRELLIAQGYLYPKSGLQYQAHHPLGNFFSTVPLDWIEARDPATVRGGVEEEMQMSR